MDREDAIVEEAINKVYQESGAAYVSNGFTRESLFIEGRFSATELRKIADIIDECVEKMKELDNIL